MVFVYFNLYFLSHQEHSDICDDSIVEILSSLISWQLGQVQTLNVTSSRHTSIIASSTTLSWVSLFLCFIGLYKAFKRHSVNSKILYESVLLFITLCIHTHWTNTVITGWLIRILNFGLIPEILSKTSLLRSVSLHNNSMVLFSEYGILLIGLSQSHNKFWYGLYICVKINSSGSVTLHFLSYILVSSNES